MPVRAIRPDGSSVLAVDCSETQWAQVKADTKRERGWRLPCCDSGVVAKTSHNGLAFFAHKSKGTCEWAEETAHHIRLKNLAVAAARAAGWEAQTEVRGRTGAGEEWVADVLAERGRARVAVEIQWSPQVEADLRARQSRYAAAGIRGLWLIRSPTFPVCPEVPAVCVREVQPGIYEALVPGNDWTKRRSIFLAEHWSYQMPAAELLAAAFSGRLRWGIRLGEPLVCEVWASTTRCWKCKAKTTPVTEILVSLSGYPVSLDIYSFDKAPALLSAIVPPKLRSENLIGPLKPRYSKTEGRSYMSNGCVACDALQGRHYEHEYAGSATVRHRVDAVLDPVWASILSPRLERHWRVMGATPQLRREYVYT